MMRFVGARQDIFSEGLRALLVGLKIDLGPSLPTTVMSTQSNGASLGRGFLSGGYVLLGVGGGVVLGYWASDWGTRFSPAVVGGILLLWMCGFALFAVGAQMERTGAGSGATTRKLGRRAAVFLTLASLSLVSLVAVFLIARPTPLTSMTDVEFRRTHDLDARYFRDLDRGLRGIVAKLESQQDLFRGDGRRALTAEEEALVLDAWASYLDTAVALDRIRLFHEDFYRFDLSRMERLRHVRSFLLSFAAELSLFENTTRIIELLAANEDVVRFLNLARPERSITVDSVAQIREELSGLTDLSRISAGRRYLAYLESVHHARVDALAESFDWLWLEVDRYLAVAEKRQRHEAVALATAGDFAPVLREVKHLTFPIQREVAEWMGSVRFVRPGHYLIASEQARDMESRLQPGDILLGRKNWYLSNLGLPGFWPHAMLYIGDGAAIASTLDRDTKVLEWVREVSGRDMTLTEYLQESYPLAWRQRESSSASNDPLTVIEAVSEGVLQNTVHGSSGDHMAAIRPRVDNVIKARAIVRAFSFLGRPYDFDFDFATDQSLVCTEVIWRAYRSSPDTPGLSLEPITVAGRLTLPPNEIARNFATEYGDDNARFDFVYYLEGRDNEARAVPATVEAFIATHNRPKW